MANPSRIYVTIDGDGRATGFCHSQINIIPPAAIEITPEQHAQWVKGQGRIYWRGGALVEVAAAPIAAPQRPQPTIESLEASLAALSAQIAALKHA